MTEVARVAGVAQHRAAFENEPALVLRRESRHLPHARYVRREHRDEHPARRLGEDLVEDLLDRALGARVPRALGIRRVRHEQGDAALAVFTESRRIEALAVRRRRVDLEIAGVYDAALWRLERDAARVDDRVRHLEIL